MTNGSAAADLSLVRERMQAWRALHPHATLTEIERELDGHLHTARATILTEVAASTGADLGRCPACAGPLVRRGTRTRTLITDGNAALTLRRPSTTCLACGAGVSPPG